MQTLRVKLTTQTASTKKELEGLTGYDVLGKNEKNAASCVSLVFTSCQPVHRLYGGLEEFEQYWKLILMGQFVTFTV